MKDLIEVNVIVFPNGNPYYFPYNPETNKKELTHYIDKWKSKYAEKYEGSGVDMAVCKITMLEEDYNSIPAKEI